MAQPTAGQRHSLDIAGIPNSQSFGRRKLLILTIAAVLLCTTMGLWIFGEPPYRREGLRLANAGRFAEAAPLLRRSLERHPVDLEVIRSLWKGWSASGNVDEAENMLGRWCVLRPRDVEPFDEQMKLRLNSRRFPEAYQDGLHLLELTPENERIRLSVAKLANILGNLNDAENQCTQLLKRQTRNVELDYLYADVLQQQGRGDEAVPFLREVLSIRSDHGQGLLLLARIHQDADEFGKSVPLLEKVIALDSDSEQRRGTLQIPARYYLGRAYHQLGRLKEAERLIADMQWRQSLELWNKYDQLQTPGLYLDLAINMVGVGKTDEAIEMMEALLKKEPAFAPGHEFLVSCYEQKGQSEKAAEHRRLARP